MENTKYHFIIEEFNLSAAIVALVALKAGYSVAFTQKYSFSKEYIPQLSYTYPLSIKKVPYALKQFSFLLKCSSLFPYLFYPVRAIKIKPQTKLPYSVFTPFDKLAGRNRESNFLPLNLQKRKVYNVVSNALMHGVLAYEYLFDEQRARYLLYKMCIDAGAVYEPNSKQVSAQFAINCEQQKQQQTIIQLRHSKWSYPNPVQIIENDFVISFFSANNKFCIQIDSENQMLIKAKVNEKIIFYLNEFEVKIAQSDIAQLTEEINAFVSNTNELLKNLRNTTNKIVSEIKKQTGISLRINSIFDSGREHQMRHQKFRELQLTCDEKFDLAKQTGICYERFTYFFYRYYSQIDDMIENAYKMMETTRDPDFIWDSIEKNTPWNRSQNIQH